MGDGYMLVSWAMATCSLNCIARLIKRRGVAITPRLLPPIGFFAVNPTLEGKMLLDSQLVQERGNPDAGRC
jgi:hypothetical protein